MDFVKSWITAIQYYYYSSLGVSSSSFQFLCSGTFPQRWWKWQSLVPRMEMSGFRNPHVLHHNPPSSAITRESSFYWSCWSTGFPPGMACPLPVVLTTCVITVVASHLTSCGWDRRKFLLITDFPSAVKEEESNNLVRKQRSFRIVSSVQTVDTFTSVQWPFLPDQESW